MSSFVRHSATRYIHFVYNVYGLSKWSMVDILTFDSMDRSTED
jgi:hypothetical protein